VALAERIQGPDHPTVGTTHNNIATLYSAQAVTATPNRAARSKSSKSVANIHGDY
jgi:hypothetical protein